MNIEEIEIKDLFDLENVAVIIPCEGAKIEYNNQVGCVACLQHGMIGHLEILWNVPLDEFGCDTWEMQRLKMERQLETHASDVFESVVAGEYGVEAWLPFTFTFTAEYLAKHPELGIEPGQKVEGILTYPNCD